MKKLLNKIKQFIQKVLLSISNGFKKFLNLLVVRKVLDVILFLPRLLSKKYAKLSNVKKSAICGYLYIMPWIVGFCLFGVYQLIYSLRMSFADNAIYVINSEQTGSNFVMKGFGLTQYIDIFKNNPEHIKVITSVITDTLIVVPLVVIFALILALLLKTKIKGIGLFRTIFFIPVILLSGSMLNYFSQYGLLNMPGAQSEVLKETIGFYFNEQITNVIGFIFSKIILILWLSGVQTIIFLAGLNKMNTSIYEAASIEGASKWDAFWKITLPALSGLIIINFVYTTVIYCNLSNNALVDLINSAMINPKYGRDYASALSWILFGIELLTIGIYSLIVKLVFKRYK